MTDIQDEYSETLEEEQLDEEAEAEDQGETEEVDPESSAEDSEEQEQEQSKTPAPQWVKNLRKEAKLLRRENRKLKQAASAAQPPGPKDPGRRPRISDFDHDEEKYEEALDGWYREKFEYDEGKRSAKAKEEEQQRHFQQKIDQYNEQKASVDLDDFKEIESEVDAEFDDVKIGIMLQMSNNAALLKYKIGSDDELFDRLSSISDPIKFAHEIGKLESSESEMKRTRKASTQPEKTVRSTKSSASYNAKLKQLEEEAARTDDRTALIKFKKQHKQRK